jgi:transposase
MAKYTEQFKLSVIEAYESGQSGFRDVAQQHDVDEATVRQWVAAYRAHGVTGIKRKYGHYGASFKRLVLQQIESEGLSEREAAARFNIRNRSVIGLWRRQYDEGGLAALSARPRGRPKNMPKQQQPITPPSSPDDGTRTRQELLDELNYLRMENAYLKKLEALARKQSMQRKKRKS